MTLVEATVVKLKMLVLLILQYGKSAVGIYFQCLDWQPSQFMNIVGKDYVSLNVRLG